MSLIAFPFAALIGLSLGLLGGGGAILTIPVFVYLLGFEPKQSIAMSLAVVGTTSLFGAAGHWRKGNLHWRSALIFGGVAMIGTFAGARASAWISGSVQMVLFSVVMLVAAFFMYRNGRREAAAKVTGGPPLEPHKASFPITALVALSVGALTGLAGVGGGFLIVPALVLLVGLPMKQAVGTSLLVISLTSFVGFKSYLGQVSVPWGYLSAFTAVAIGGILVGTWASKFVSQATLKSVFSGFLVVMGIFVLYKNRDVLRGSSTALSAPVTPSQ